MAMSSKHKITFTTYVFKTTAYVYDLRSEKAEYIYLNFEGVIHIE